MFLFTKRTRNIIKIFWGFFATLIIISMVFTYTGLTRLTGTQPAQPIEVSPEDLDNQQNEQLDISKLSTSSPELQELFKSIETDMASGTQTGTRPEDKPVATTPPAPPVPQLNFGI